MSPQNWKNKTIFTGDNLYVMRGMNSDSVDLIYIDPPFNSNKAYAAPIGSKAAGAAFKDSWTLSDLDLVEAGRLREEYGNGLYKFMEAAQYTHSKGMRSYLIMMASRLVEMRRILKPTGSICLHCDPTASHYLKGIMDAIFGKGCFRNEIAWCYTGPATGKIRHFPKKHDVLLWYSAGAAWTFNRDAVRIPYHPETMARRARGEGARGIVSASAETTKKRGAKEAQRRFSGGKLPEDYWTGIPILTNQKERTGYPTQKPLALLERIIKAFSNKNDIVFDPFCGCATALVMADRLQRQWAGIDLSPKAVELLVDRIAEDQGIFKDITKSSGKPMRTDLGPELDARGRKARKGALFALQDQTCNGCGTWFARLEDFEMDHITPKSEGGTDHAHNFQLLCANCNRKKGKKSQEEFMAAMAQTRGRRLAGNQGELA